MKGVKAVGSEVVWKSPVTTNPGHYDDILIPQAKLMER
jgi:hypothetical protein